MRKKRLLLLLSLALLLVNAPGIWADCTAHNGYKAFEGDMQNGPYCAEFGSGCVECINWNPGPGVLFNDCYYDAWTGDVYCYSYGTGENQMP